VEGWCAEERKRRASGEEQLEKRRTEMKKANKEGEGRSKGGGTSERGMKDEKTVKGPNAGCERVKKVDVLQASLQPADTTTATKTTKCQTNGNKQATTRHAQPEE